MSYHRICTFEGVNDERMAWDILNTMCCHGMYVHTVVFVNFLSFLPPGVFVCFDETAYSVIEGEEVTIGITANRGFTSPFNVTVTHGDPG